MGESVWQEDLLGGGFQQLTLPLGTDGEGDVVATLVRHRPPLGDLVSPFAPARGTDVLYVHGWSDYFFQTGLAEYWQAAGARFYALDLRKYGRSLRDYQTPGYVADLATYDADIEAALAVMGHGADADRPSRRRLLLMGHSTGGLTLSLWAARHSGRASALVLNSPWLEFQAGGVGRAFLAPLVQLGARVQPLGTLPQVDLGFYSRSVSHALGGEWDYAPQWRPQRGFPAHQAWLNAVLEGHATVAAGLDIDAPVLVLLSKRSTILPRWSEQMRSSDSVLVVDEIARAAVRLGSTVTISRIEGALHDVVLSAEPARKAAYASLTRWLRAYAPSTSRDL
ncbi:alpha/beta hydrolase [Cryobacterium sp. 1639]|uniref:alpha/beta hydrolase n=1 Tax=Cryobacterium inferilacus TaxID=2866629 RepID=UPI001C738C93|nr:alpha/beta hydrolase [Cryobacterium sp. 1639]MBX0301776.1 alpha/beta hydrolase [Cryobacterium sp. 1639]